MCLLNARDTYIFRAQDYVVMRGSFSKCCVAFVKQGWWKAAFVRVEYMSPEHCAAQTNPRSHNDVVM